MQKKFPAKEESSEASTVFTERKKAQYNRENTTQGEKVTELQPPGNFNYFYRAFLPVLLWSIIFICLVHSPYLVYHRIFPCVRTPLLARMNFMGKASLDITPPLTSREPFCALVVKEICALVVKEIS